MALVVFAVLPAAAESQYPVKMFTREIDDGNSYAFVQSGAPIDVGVCTFHGTRVSYTRLRRVEISHLVTHGTVGIQNNGESTFAEVAIFGFRNGDFTHPVVGSIERFVGRDTEGDVDLTWDVERKLGDVSMVHRFVCGLIRARSAPNAPVWSDHNMVRLYHSISWGQAWGTFKVDARSTIEAARTGM